MDAQIENHLPLITSRLVFAPKVFPTPPTITLRMEFPSINIEARDDSPAPENGAHRRRAETPASRATPLRRASTPKISRPLQRSSTVGPSSARENKVSFDDQMELDSLSSLTEDEDMEKDMAESEAGGEVFSESEKGDREVGEGLIPKPKGDVSRPGRGGYNLFKTLGWSQKTYDSVLALVTKLAKEKLKTSQSYRGQSKKAIQHLAATVRKDYGFIGDYDKDWPVHDMLKTYLKNSSQTARNAKGRKTAKEIDKIVKRASDRTTD